MPTNTPYTSYAQHANATITVTNTAQLNAALSNLSSSGGGTILLDGNGGPYNISGNGIGDVNNPILIKALDPTNQPLVQNIYLQNSSYISMTELDVNSSGQPTTVQDLRISNGDHIEFVGNTMTSTANGFLDGSGTAIKGANAALIRNSSDIVFSGNTITDYAKGVSFLETVGLDFSNNELTGIQYDGFRAGGIQNANISNNYMHDFYGTLQTINHSDFIQIWSTNTQLVTSNVQINGNVLDTNGGSTSQGIFIGNEGTRGGANGPMYQDIRIFDNVVHTASWHGIAAEGTQNLQIYNNTVLFDDQAFGKTSATSAWFQNPPWIRATNSPNATVQGNVAGKVVNNGVVDNGTSNQILDYNDPTTATFVDNFMASLPPWSGGYSGGASNIPSGGGNTAGSGTTGGAGGNNTIDTSGGAGNTGNPDSGGATNSPVDATGGNGSSTGSGATTDGPNAGSGSNGTGGNAETPAGTGNAGNSASPPPQQAGESQGGGEATISVSSIYQKTMATVVEKFNIEDAVSARAASIVVNGSQPLAGDPTASTPHATDTGTTATSNQPAATEIAASSGTGGVPDGLANEMAAESITDQVSGIEPTTPSEQDSETSSSSTAEATAEQASQPGTSDGADTASSNVSEGSGSSEAGTLPAEMTDLVLTDEDITNLFLPVEETDEVPVPEEAELQEFTMALL